MATPFIQLTTLTDTPIHIRLDTVVAVHNLEQVHDERLMPSPDQTAATGVHTYSGKMFVVKESIDVVMATVFAAAVQSPDANAATTRFMDEMREQMRRGGRLPGPEDDIDG